MNCYCCGGKVAWLSDEEIEEDVVKLDPNPARDPH